MIAKVINKIESKYIILLIFNPKNEYYYRIQNEGMWGVVSGN